jgi:hypothetical protein
LKGNARIFESNVALSKNLIALAPIPIEISNIREQSLEIFFRHSDPPPKMEVPIPLVPLRVRYDGFDAARFAP